MSSFWKPKSSAAKEDDKTGPAQEGKPKEAEAPKAATADAPAPAPAAAAAPAKRKPDDPPAAEGKPKVTFKKRRTESVESHEFHICDANITSIDFEVPPGATMGKATFTWSFE